MNRRTLAAALVLLSVAFACRAKRKKVIAVIPKATSHQFWGSVHAGAAAAAGALGVEVLWNGPALETDYSRQIQIVDSMIARRVDGLAISAAESKSLVQPVDRAMAAGIPVAVFDSGLDSENYTTFVATNNYEAGRLAARTLARLLQHRGKIAVIMHTPGSESTIVREKGFDDAIEKEYPEIHVVARQFGYSDRGKAMAAAENILTAHPDLDGMFASAEPSSVGAALALKNQGGSSRVKLVAFDSTEGLIQDLKGGVIQALVVQDPFRIGYEAVRALVDKLNGKTPPKHVDLSATVVFAKDLKRTEIQQLVSPDLSKYFKP